MPIMSEPAVDAFYRSLGQRVRAARDEAGITQTQLAEGIGLTRSSVANLEAGRQRIMLHVAVSIAELLGTQLSELIVEAEQRGFDLERLGQQIEQHQDYDEHDRNFVISTVRASVKGETPRDPS
jgi:transcriptional regulator with XRE-family HTH domain